MKLTKNSYRKVSKEILGKMQIDITLKPTKTNCWNKRAWQVVARAQTPGQDSDI